MRGPDALVLELLGIREQMRTVLSPQTARYAQSWTVSMDKATDIYELLAGGKLRSRAVRENVRT
jgi:hypothetical protein